MAVQNYPFVMYAQQFQGRSKKYDEMSHWKLAEREISHYDVTPIEMKVRKIRLERMFQEIKTRLKVAKPKEQTPRPDPYEKIKEARRMGNEFSETNRFSHFSNYFKYKVKRVRPNQAELRKLLARKKYGNMKSEENREKIRKVKTTISETSFPEVTLPKPVKKAPSKSNKYGQYYSNRFKVQLKLKKEDYDIEFQQLIMECLEFEKTHNDVSSVIEEIINSNKALKDEMSQIQMLMSKMGDEDEDCFEDDEIEALYGKDDPSTSQTDRTSELVIDLTPSTLVEDQLDNEDDATSISLLEKFDSLTKIVQGSDTNTRCYKYSVENTSLISLEKPDSDHSDESSRIYESARPSPIQENQKTSEEREEMFKELEFKLFEEFNLQDPSIKPVVDKLSPIHNNLLEGKHSETTIKNILTALINK